MVIDGNLELDEMATEMQTTEQPARVRQSDGQAVAARKPRNVKVTDAIEKAAKNVPAPRKDEAVVSFNRPKGLAKLTMAKLIDGAKTNYVQGVGHIATAACFIAECNRRVLDAKKTNPSAPTWAEFCAANFGNMSKARLTELVFIGKADNPAQALVDMRARVADRVQESRARNAVAPTTLPAIPPAKELAKLDAGEQRKILREAHDAQAKARKLAEAKAADLEKKAAAARAKAEQELAKAREEAEAAKRQASEAVAKAAETTLPTADPFDTLAVVKEGFAGLKRNERREFLTWLAEQLTAGERKLVAGATN